MSSQFPSASSPQRLFLPTPANANVKKKPLKPGHSLMDWIRLTKSGADLRGVRSGMLRITEVELAKHNTPNDAWMALNGFVYNVSQYMSYHPGGREELMRGVGMDATTLFNEIHRWVNYESMLKACLIGKFVPSDPLQKLKGPSANFLTPAVPTIPSKLRPAYPKPEASLKVKTMPSFILSTEWKQTDQDVTLTCHLSASISSQNIVCDLVDNNQRLKASIFNKSATALIDVQVSASVEAGFKINCTNQKTVDILMIKSKQGSDVSLKYLTNHGKTMAKTSSSENLDFRSCTLLQKNTVTHDTALYVFKLPSKSHMQVPIGHHVYLKADIDNITIMRPYTVVLRSLFVQSKPNEEHNQVIYLMIKSYEDGSLTPHISKMKIGDEILLSTYEGSFDVTILRPFEEIVLFCGGTGFTPMVRVINYCLFESDSKNVKLFFFNKTSQDILWKAELEQLQSQFSARFLVQHVLSRPDQQWNGKTGYITRDHLVDAYKSPVASTEPPVSFTCLCGPPIFTRIAVDLMKHYGVEPSNLHVFTS